MHRSLPALTLAIALALSPLPTSADESWTERVAAASVGEHRSAANRARNEYRHPTQTLTFFGFEDGMRVLEIWPGGGWYSEILAPAIRDHGEYFIANWDPEVAGQPAYRYDLPKRLAEKFAADPARYDQVQEVFFSPPESASLGPEDHYDLVLTFRNTHGWVGGGLAEDVFAEFARVLKPGGVLGVVQHRAPTGSDPAASARSGYVPQGHVKALAEAAGLVFVSSSSVNANPADTKDHPEGVWTLPPGLRLGDEDREKYLAIGESDRMTLKFVKPTD